MPGRWATAVQGEPEGPLVKSATGGYTSITSEDATACLARPAHLRTPHRRWPAPLDVHLPVARGARGKRNVSAQERVPGAPPRPWVPPLPRAARQLLLRPPGARPRRLGGAAPQPAAQVGASAPESKLLSLRAFFFFGFDNGVQTNAEFGKLPDDNKYGRRIVQLSAKFEF